MFLRVNTQWSRSGLGQPVDLDYTAVDVVLRRLALDPAPDDFERLMLLGRSAAAELRRLAPRK